VSTREFGVYRLVGADKTVSVKVVTLGLAHLSAIAEMVELCWPTLSQ
jgi:hypothetical protein